MQIEYDKPSTSQVNLSYSQNPLYSKTDRISLLKGSFGLYMMSFFPALISSIITLNSRELRRTIPKYPKLVIFFSVCAGFLAVGLSFSKRMSRKRPFNVLLFIMYMFSVAVLAAGVEVSFGKISIIALIYLVTNSLAMLVYILTVEDTFLIKHSVFYVLGFLLIPLITLSIVYRKLIVYVISFYITTFFISLIILYASQAMVRNSSFEMLPDDYIMGAMRLVVILPLIPDLVK